MIELVFLLLPIAAAYGWYMGHRSAKKDQEDTTNKISRDYVAGVNLLLSNQQDKAVDLFLNMLEQREKKVVDVIDSESQFEAKLTLGNLFRSRGEIDRALRIHQSIENSENYSFDQKLLVRQQLAIDFMAMGFYDRAEDLYLTLIDEPEYQLNALSQLAILYQITKEWKQAVNVAEKSLKIAPKMEHMSLAHFYCEYASQISQREPKKANELLHKAFNVSPSCVRVLILLADIAAIESDYPQAITFLEQVLERNPAFVGEIISKLEEYYTNINKIDKFESFLTRANRVQKNSKVQLALSELIEQKDGKVAAQGNLYNQLKAIPNMLVFHRFIQYQIDEAEQGRAKDSLILLHKMVGHQIVNSMAYRCIQCGYQTQKLIWSCPSCRQWETIRPTNNINDKVSL